MSSSPRLAASLLRSSARALARATMAHVHERFPEVLAAVPASFADPRDDVEVRWLHLAAAVELDRPALFEHAVAWYGVALHHRGVPAAYLARGLEAMAEVAAAELPAAAASLARRHLDAARGPAETPEVELPSRLDKDAPHGLLACRFLLATLEGRAGDAFELVERALDEGLSVADLHDHVLAPIQQEVGRMWLTGEIGVADEHLTSAVVERALWSAQSRLPAAPDGAPVVLTLGVAGDLHGLGLRMIAQRLQADGLRVYDLGANVPAADLEGALHDRPVDLVAVGATMLLHLHTLAVTVAELRRVLGASVPVLAGGQPFTVVEDLHELVGVDAAATDARSAVAAARRLLAERAG